MARRVRFAPPVADATIPGGLSLATSKIWRRGRRNGEPVPVPGSDGTVHPAPANGYDGQTAQPPAESVRLRSVRIMMVGFAGAGKTTFMTSTYRHFNGGTKDRIKFETDIWSSTTMTSSWGY
jgi:hypothetical protein